MSIELGNKVRDLVTGFEGIAIARIEYLNGCVQIALKGPAVDNETKDAHYLDINQLEKIDDGITPTIRSKADDDEAPHEPAEKKTGGIMEDRPKRGIGMARL